jgi:hypothetical protein
MAGIIDTLAYYNLALITAVKSFIVQTFGYWDSYKCFWLPQ